MYHVNRSLNSTNSVDLCIIGFHRNRDIPIKTIYSTKTSRKTARLIWSHATENIYTVNKKVSNCNTHNIKIKKKKNRGKEIVILAINLGEKKEIAFNYSNLFPIEIRSTDSS